MREKKTKRGRERVKAKIMHIDDDGDVEQGCGFFSSYVLVSVLHASSMSVNIYMLRTEEEGPKTSDAITTGILVALMGCTCKRICRRVVRKKD
jgi:hypothetical protein